LKKKATARVRCFHKGEILLRDFRHLRYSSANKAGEPLLCLWDVKPSQTKTKILALRNVMKKYNPDQMILLLIVKRQFC
jgi:hypothetical protein